MNTTNFTNDMKVTPIMANAKQQKYYCVMCGAEIIGASHGKKYCAECLKRNVEESKKRYENRRRQASMSEPKRAAITHNHALQIIIRNMEHSCAVENNISSLSSFNRWANTTGKDIYMDYSKKCICAFLEQYLSSQNGNPLQRMANITRESPVIRIAYISECIKRQKAAGFETMGDFQQYEQNNLKEAGKWRAELVIKEAMKDMYVLNLVDFRDAGDLLSGNGGWR